MLNQITIEKSTTKTKGTTDVTQFDGGITFFGAHFGGGRQHWVEKSTAETEGETKTSASTNWLYVPKGKSGHVVFFPYYEEHCGPATVLRKPSLQDEENFDCNYDYERIIKADGNMERIRGMGYKWDGIDPADVYNYEERVSKPSLPPFPAHTHKAILFGTFRLTIGFSASCSPCTTSTARPRVSTRCAIATTRRTAARSARIAT